MGETDSPSLETTSVFLDGKTDTQVRISRVP